MYLQKGYYNSFKTLQRKPFVNNRIRAEKVRIIDETGKQIGILPLTKALRMSRERNLDLIQVTEKVEPPICKIMDYGKYLYQQKKKEKLAKPHKGGELKGIRLGFGISEHDLKIRALQAGKFLKEGNKVRIEMQLRGRQKALRGFAEEKIKNFLEVLEKLIPIRIERELKKKPRGLTMIISKK